jgi:hypothetical protein
MELEKFESHCKSLPCHAWVSDDEIMALLEEPELKEWNLVVANHLMDYDSTIIKNACDCWKRVDDFLERHGSMFRVEQVRREADGTYCWKFRIAL